MPHVLAQTRSAQQLRRAQQAFQQGRLAEAQGLYQALLHKHNHKSTLLFGQAQVLQALGRTRQAQRLYQAALPTLPKAYQSWAHNNLGVLWIKQKRYQRAIQHLSTALMHNPNYERARYNLELALRLLHKQKQQRRRPRPQQGKRRPPPPRKPSQRRPPPKRQKRPPPSKRRTAPPKRRPLKLPDIKSLKLQPYDRFLPYSRVLKHKRKLRSQP